MVALVTSHQADLSIRVRGNFAQIDPFASDVVFRRSYSVFRRLDRTFGAGYALRMRVLFTAIAVPNLSLPFLFFFLLLVVQSAS